MSKLLLNITVMCHITWQLNVHVAKLNTIGHSMNKGKYEFSKYMLMQGKK